MGNVLLGNYLVTKDRQGHDRCTAHRQTHTHRQRNKAHRHTETGAETEAETEFFGALLAACHLLLFHLRDFRFPCEFVDVGMVPFNVTSAVTLRQEGQRLASAGGTSSPRVAVLGVWGPLVTQQEHVPEALRQAEGRVARRLHQRMGAVGNVASAGLCRCRFWHSRASCRRVDRRSSRSCTGPAAAGACEGVEPAHRVHHRLGRQGAGRRAD